MPWYQIYNGLFGRYTLTFAWRTHPFSICLLRLSAYLSVVPALYLSPRLQRLYMTHYIFKRYKYFFSSTVLLHGLSFQFRTRIFWTTLMLTAAKEKRPPLLLKARLHGIPTYISILLAPCIFLSTGYRWGSVIRIYTRSQWRRNTRRQFMCGCISLCHHANIALYPDFIS